MTTFKSLIETATGPYWTVLGVLVILSALSFVFVRRRRAPERTTEVTAPSTAPRTTATARPVSTTGTPVAGNFEFVVGSFRLKPTRSRGVFLVTPTAKTHEKLNADVVRFYLQLRKRDAATRQRIDRFIPETKFPKSPSGNQLVMVDLSKSCHQLGRFEFFGPQMATFGPEHRLHPWSVRINRTAALFSAGLGVADPSESPVYHAFWAEQSPLGIFHLPFWGHQKMDSSEVILVELKSRAAEDEAWFLEAYWRDLGVR